MWKLRDGLELLKPYLVEEKEWDVKLDANESPFNLPPLVQERLLNRLSYLAFHRYPDISMTGLRSQIAAAFHLQPENVLIGNGSSEILLALCHALGGQGRNIVFPDPSFSMYGIYAKVTDSQAVPVTLEQDFALDREKLLNKALEAKANVIILCNPNNPTGTTMPVEDIEYIATNVTCPVIVDEAYQEFYGESAVGLIRKYPNLAVTRTFSKAYGLAAARVGYMMAEPSLVQAVGKVMMPYHVNALSLAVAEVVYQMRDELVPGIKQIITERGRLAEALKQYEELTVYPSATNFLLIQLNRAKELAEYLAERSICIRDFNATKGLAGCLRVTVGSAVENDAFIKAVGEFFERG